MKTQNQLVLEHLAKHHNEWVAMPELVAVSGSFNIHSRIAELRTLGHRIEHLPEGSKPRRSYYRLVSPIQEVLPV